MNMKSSKKEWKSEGAELRGEWRRKADALIPELQHGTVSPESPAERIRPEKKASELPLPEWEKGESLILDFSEHHAGYFVLSMHIAEGYCDSPVSLRLPCLELHAVSVPAAEMILHEHLGLVLPLEFPKASVIIGQPGSVPMHWGGRHEKCVRSCREAEPDSGGAQSPGGRGAPERYESRNLSQVSLSAEFLCSGEDFRLPFCQ